MFQITHETTIAMTRSKFPDFSLTFHNIFNFPWPITKFPDNSLTFAWSGISLTFPWPLDTLNKCYEGNYVSQHWLVRTKIAHSDVHKIVFPGIQQVGLRVFGQCITKASRGRQSFSNRQQLGCLFNRLLVQITKMHWRSTVLTLCWRINRPLIDSPHEMPVMRNGLPCQYVLMNFLVNIIPEFGM